MFPTNPETFSDQQTSLSSQNILPISKHRSKVAARWFFCHAFANLGVVITALPSVIAVLKDPLNAMNAQHHSDTSMFGSGSVWPLTIINSIHVYHMIGGFGLSSADYFHHGMFIPTLGFPGQIFSFGAGANWQAFYVSARRLCCVQVCCFFLR